MVKYSNYIFLCACTVNKFIEQKDISFWFASSDCTVTLKVNWKANALTFADQTITKTFSTSDKQLQ